MKKIILLSVFVIFGVLLAFCQSGLQTYPSIPGFDGYQSTKYDVTVQVVYNESVKDGVAQSIPVYYLESTGNGAERMSHSHWTTFSFTPDETSEQVMVEIVLKDGNINKYEFRPTHVSNIVST